MKIYHQNIIACYGFFEQSNIVDSRPTYNLLLEYANYDLETYFADTLPPTNAKDVIWKQLYGVVDALRTIHHPSPPTTNDQSLVGFHFDLKPANILVCEDGPSWKIADFGFSKFVHCIDGEPPEVTPDGGTHMYST